MLILKSGSKKSELMKGDFMSANTPKKIKVLGHAKLKKHIDPKMRTLPGGVFEVIDTVPTRIGDAFRIKHPVHGEIQIISSLCQVVS